MLIVDPQLSLIMTRKLIQFRLDPDPGSHQEKGLSCTLDYQSPSMHVQTVIHSCILQLESEKTKQNGNREDRYQHRERNKSDIK